MYSEDHRTLEVNGQGHGKVQHDEDDIVTFNVGGTAFKTLRSTIERQSLCRLNDRDFLERHYRSSLGEYFFDRDPDMFKCLMNYLRTGELHLPSNTCAPVLKRDIAFWGLKTTNIEKCCWLSYNEWGVTQKALKRLEHHRKYLTRDSHVANSASGWTRWRSVGWMFLNDSASSLAAKIFGWVSFCFVVVAIFSFLADTTAYFEHYVTSNNGSLELPSSEVRPNHTSHLVTNASKVPYLVSNSVVTMDTNHTDNLTNNTNQQVYEEKIRSTHPALEIIDWICLAFFTTEYIIRVVFAPRRLKHVTTLLSVIDFLALLPDFIELIVYEIRPDLRNTAASVGVLTVLRVIRVLRIFRLMRHSAGLWILVFTLRASFSELLLLVWFLGLGMLVFASLIYYTEDRGDFESIPAGFWWALITMTTVGYGDMYPKTILGKVVGSVCAMSGVLMIGFTVPALVNNFMLYYRHIQFATNKQSDDEAEAEEDIDVTSGGATHAQDAHNDAEKAWDISKQGRIGKNRVDDVRAMERLLNGNAFSEIADK